MITLAYDGGAWAYMGLACAAAAVLGLLAWRTGLRLRRLREGIDRIASGDVEHRLPLYRAGATGKLSLSLNRMAREFNHRIRSLRQQRNEQEAVLASMIEGVLAVDLDERLIFLNAAASTLLRIDPRRAQGRSIQEVIRNTAVQQFVATAIGKGEPIEEDLVLRIGGDDGEVRELFVQALGAVLRDASGERIGALIVLHDVTRLRRLEMVRRDFVANVSHEVKTPITAIKGSVETLLDTPGSADDDTRRFLEIIARQADRLNAIVEDLLALARVEQDAERDRVPLQPATIPHVLAGAIEACQVRADARRIRLERTCDDGLTCRVNAQLLEQAVINLVDNAVKYSPDGSTVRVGAGLADGELVISVADEGVGIEPEHLPRLFERFYRTDKARSRAMGGTGLGLAIVKHIAQAHGGRVEVDSVVGRGSTFRLHLPA